MNDRRKQRRWTEDDLNKTAAGKKQKSGRYGNVRKIEEDGHRFDSFREYRRYWELKALQAGGLINNLTVHPSYDIVIGGVPIMVCSNQHGKWDRQLRYEADFEYYDYELGREVIEDVKMQSGHRTAVYRLKRALMKAMGYEITEY